MTLALNAQDGPELITLEIILRRDLEFPQ